MPEVSIAGLHRKTVLGFSTVDWQWADDQWNLEKSHHSLFPSSGPLTQNINMDSQTTDISSNWVSTGSCHSWYATENASFLSCKAAKLKQVQREWILTLFLNFENIKASGSQPPALAASGAPLIQAHWLKYKNSPYGNFPLPKATNHLVWT